MYVRFFPHAVVRVTFGRQVPCAIRKLLLGSKMFLVHLYNNVVSSNIEPYSHVSHYCQLYAPVVLLTS